jgi:predicted nucleic acid-binding protein
VEIEILAKPGMEAGEEAEARAVLKHFRRVEINDAAIETAIQIRRAKDLLLPDALIAASAIALNATVLSNDPHLRDYKRGGYKALPVI